MHHGLSFGQPFAAVDANAHLILRHTVSFSCQKIPVVTRSLSVCPRGAHAASDALSGRRSAVPRSPSLQWWSVDFLPRDSQESLRPAILRRRCGRERCGLIALGQSMPSLNIASCAGMSVTGATRLAHGGWCAIGAGWPARLESCRPCAMPTMSAPGLRNAAGGRSRYRPHRQRGVEGGGLSACVPIRVGRIARTALSFSFIGGRKEGSSQIIRERYRRFRLVPARFIAPLSVSRDGPDKRSTPASSFSRHRVPAVHADCHADTSSRGRFAARASMSVPACSRSFADFAWSCRSTATMSLWTA